MIHIIGSTSLVGHFLSTELSELFPINEYSRNLGNLDLSSGSIKITNYDVGDFWIFLASIAHPMMCEEKPDYAYMCNVLGTSKIIEEIISKSGKVLFFSTDMVYGEGGPFTEKSPTKPSGVYADSKLKLEEKFKHEPNFFSLRMSYFLGRDIFSNYVIDTAESNQTIEVYRGFSRNAINKKRVLSTILGYISGDIDANLINLAGDRCLEREEIVEIILSEKNLHGNVKVVDAPEGYFSIRPRRIEIDNSLLKSYEQ